MSSPKNVAAEFEAGTLDNCNFGHHDHVRVIWELVHSYGTLEGLKKFEAGLKRIATASGHPEKYHATITHVFAFVVGGRIAEQGATSWDEFVTTNADVLEWPNGILERMYPGDALKTDAARTTFVLPFESA